MPTLFRPRPLGSRTSAGLTSFPAAPFADASASGSGTLSLIPTAANWRDRQSCSGRARRKSKWPRGFARPGHRNSHNPGQPSVASRAALGNWPALLMAELVGPRPRRWTSRPAVSGFTLTPENRPAFRSVPAARTQKRKGAHSVARRGNEVTRQNWQVRLAPASLWDWHGGTDFAVGQRCMRLMVAGCKAFAAGTEPNTFCG